MRSVGASVAHCSMPWERAVMAVGRVSMVERKLRKARSRATKKGILWEHWNRWYGVSLRGQRWHVSSSLP